MSGSPTPTPNSPPDLGVLGWLGRVEQDGLERGRYVPGARAVAALTGLNRCAWHIVLDALRAQADPPRPTPGSSDGAPGDPANPTSGPSFGAPAETWHQSPIGAVAVDPVPAASP